MSCNARKIIAWHGKEWHGMEREGNAGNDMERNGMTWKPKAIQCMAWCGKEKKCKARHCLAWKGKEMQGMAWQGDADPRTLGQDPLKIILNLPS
jgi:hypothetical protein